LTKIQYGTKHDSVNVLVFNIYKQYHKSKSAKNIYKSDCDFKQQINKQ